MEGYDLLQERTVWVPAEAPRSIRREKGGRAATGSRAMGLPPVTPCSRRSCTAFASASSATPTCCGSSVPSEVLEACIDPASLEDEARRRACRTDRARRLPAAALRHDQRYRRSGHLRVVAPKPDGYEKHWKHFDLSSRLGLPSLARARGDPRHNRGGAEPRHQHHRRARRLRSEPLPHRSSRRTSRSI